MDLPTLTTQVFEAVSPHLPALAGTASTSAAKALGTKAPDAVVALWRKLTGRMEAKPSASEAVSDLAASPSDGDAAGAFRSQLRKLLEEDSLFATEIQALVDQVHFQVGHQIVASGSGGVAVGPGSVAAGAGGVAIGGGASVGSITTGTSSSGSKQEAES